MSKPGHVNIFQFSVLHSICKRPNRKRESCAKRGVRKGYTKQLAGKGHRKMGGPSIQAHNTNKIPFSE